MIGESILHYRVLAKIGEGGMGIVYSAVDTRLGRTVAHKAQPSCDYRKFVVIYIGRFRLASALCGVREGIALTRVMPVEPEQLGGQLLGWGNMCARCARSYHRNTIVLLDILSQFGPVHGITGAAIRPPPGR